MSGSKVFNDLFLTGQLTISNTIKFVDDSTKISLQNGKIFLKDNDFNNKSLSDCITQVLNHFYNFSQISQDNLLIHQPKVFRVPPQLNQFFFQVQNF